eukprot:2815937-Prymnesium_polylepis.2
MQLPIILERQSRGQLGDNVRARHPHHGADMRLRLARRARRPHEQPGGLGDERAWVPPRDVVQQEAAHECRAPRAEVA